MGWAAAGAGLGLIKAQQDQEQQRKANLMQAEQSRYAPFLAMGGVNSGPGQLSFNAPTQFDRVLQGGTMGLMAGQAYNDYSSANGTNVDVNDGQTMSGNKMVRGGKGYA